MKNKKLSPPVMFWITFAIAAAGSIASVVINNNGDFTGRFTVALIIYVLFFVFAIFADVKEIRHKIERNDFWDEFMAYHEKMPVSAKQAESYNVIIPKKENEEETGVVTPDWLCVINDNKIYKYRASDADIWILRNGMYQPFQRVKPLAVCDVSSGAIDAEFNPIE